MSRDNHQIVQQQHEQESGEDVTGLSGEETTSGKSSKQNLWMMMGVMSALGFEFVGMVVVAFVAGTWVDERFETAPFGLFAILILALAAVGVHVTYVAKRFLRSGQ